MNTYSAKFNPIELDKIKENFKNENAIFSTPQYMYFQARAEGFSASFYESGKFVIQGKNTAAIVNKYFGQNIAEKPQTLIVEYPHIGIDESGKGDFFGPLVIAGVYLNQAQAKHLEKLGACDSKKLTDKKILNLENEIKNSSVYDIVTIGPKKYNELYLKFKNLNKLLGWGHACVLENLLQKTDAKIAISDKFAKDDVIISALKQKGKNIKLIQQTKAESDTAVAAASILARAEFVKRMAALSQKYELNLPKGANPLVLEQAKKFSTQYGKCELINIAKLHFKTYESV